MLHSRAQDVCEAVLDDGAQPTVPEWARPLFHELIDACLDRTPDARPSFTDIIMLLREKLACTEAYLFAQYDRPRLMEQLGMRVSAQICIFFLPRLTSCLLVQGDSLVLISFH